MMTTIKNIKLILSILAFMGIISIDANLLKAFTNPLNNKKVDVFFIWDEARSFLNTMQHGQVKSTLNLVASELNPASSIPYFGLYVYGSTSNVGIAVPFTTNNSATFKKILDAKPFPILQANPSTLSMALSAVSSDCASFCRSEAPRVTVIISSRLDASVENDVRRLESELGMTILVIPIGNINNNTANSHLLATHPEEVYVMPVADYFQLSTISEHLSSTISDIPRILQKDSFIYVSVAANHQYHTMQINTAPYTVDDEAIVMVATSCVGCPLYGSLSEPLPTSWNSNSNTDRHKFYAANGYPNTFYYFRVRKNTRKIFISFLGNGELGVYFTANVTPIPRIMNQGIETSIDGIVPPLIG